MVVEINESGAILSFGELLLRICPDAQAQWLTENKLPFYVGGAEPNVANALGLTVKIYNSDARFKFKNS